MSALNPAGYGVTSLSLLERVKGHDNRSWERLVQIYGPLVLFSGRASGLDDASAADVAQEVWQSVSRAIDQFQRKRESGTFRG